MLSAARADSSAGFNILSKANIWILRAQAMPVYVPGDAPGAPGVGLLASASGPVALVGPAVHCAPGALLQARFLDPKPLMHDWVLSQESLRLLAALITQNAHCQV